MTDGPFLPVPVRAFGRLAAGDVPTLTGWLAEVGEPVVRGQRVAEVTVPGVLVEAVSPADGVVVRQNVAAGQPADPGEPLGWVERHGG